MALLAPAPAMTTVTATAMAAGNRARLPTLPQELRPATRPRRGVRPRGSWAWRDPAPTPGSPARPRRLPPMLRRPELPSAAANPRRPQRTSAPRRRRSEPSRPPRSASQPRARWGQTPTWKRFGTWRGVWCAKGISRSRATPSSGPRSWPSSLKRSAFGCGRGPASRTPRLRTAQYGTPCFVAFAARACWRTGTRTFLSTAGPPFTHTTFPSATARTPFCRGSSRKWPLPSKTSWPSRSASLTAACGARRA
mmetsp:Transcript_3466/g.14281  ORF Transcript_3466/g.14281 Transcript_3466/m.14281 type:complete len:251 (+) Transcript_3466:1632-2384(+)